jgi:hypothetical protein
LAALPEMRQQKVSQVARSPGQFVDQYRKANGNPKNLPDHWRRKRNAFVARHLKQYRQHPTERRRLALIAWAFNP